MLSPAFSGTEWAEETVANRPHCQWEKWWCSLHFGGNRESAKGSPWAWPSSGKSEAETPESKYFNIYTNTNNILCPLNCLNLLFTVQTFQQTGGGLVPASAEGDQHFLSWWIPGCHPLSHPDSSVSRESPDEHTRSWFKGKAVLVIGSPAFILLLIPRVIMWGTG